MDPIRNPFAPGAGSRPPELAGRERIIEDAKTALHRSLKGRSTKSQILLGLRGTGKTVLLNEIEQLAEDIGHITSVIEAPEDKSLAALLYPKAHQALRKLSNVETAKHATRSALRALRSFAAAFKITVGDFEVAVEPTLGVSDSGDIELDLVDLFIEIGQAAKAAGKGWTLLIDEVQYLKQNELSALIVAIHRISQKGLPILVAAAGLPQIAQLSGDAKSYAERLFDFPPVGALSMESASVAIRKPIEDEGVTIDRDAMGLIFQKTEGYPFFLQEWGYNTWNIAKERKIKYSDVQKASLEALRRLDDGFFKVRIDRLTNAETDYVNAMAQLGRGPYKSSEVAAQLGKENSQLGPRRAQIIRKGMIYSPSYGEIDFTVPMFDDFICRKIGNSTEPTFI